MYQKNPKVLKKSISENVRRVVSGYEAASSSAKLQRNGADKPSSSPSVSGSKKLKKTKSLKPSESYEMDVNTPRSKADKIMKNLKDYPSTQYFKSVEELFRIPIQEFEANQLESDMSELEVLGETDLQEIKSKTHQRIKEQRELNKQQIENENKLNQDLSPKDRFNWAKKIILRSGEMIFPGINNLQQNYAKAIHSKPFKNWMANNGTTQRIRSSVWAAMTTHGNQAYLFLWTALYLLTLDITLDALKYIHKLVLIFSLVMFEFLTITRIYLSKKGNQNDDMLDLNTALAFNAFSLFPLIFIMITDVFLKNTTYFTTIISSIFIFLMVMDFIASAVQVNYLMNDARMITLMAHKSWKALQAFERNSELRSERLQAKRRRQGYLEHLSYIEPRTITDSGSEQSSTDSDDEEDTNTKSDSEESGVWENLPFPINSQSQSTESDNSSQRSSKSITSFRSPKFNTVRPISSHDESQESVTEIWKTRDPMLGKKKSKTEQREAKPKEIDTKTDALPRAPIKPKPRTKTVCFEDEISNTKLKDKENKPSPSGSTSDHGRVFSEKEDSEERYGPGPGRGPPPRTTTSKEKDGKTKTKRSKREYNDKDMDSKP